MQAKSAPTAVPKRNTRAFVSKYKSAIIVMIGSFILAVILATKAGPSSLFNTLVTGGMWALMAVGLSLVFGVMNVAHFAHGESFMVGAFIGYFVAWLIMPEALPATVTVPPPPAAAFHSDQTA